MSIFAFRHRLEHAQQQDNGGGGNAPPPTAPPTAPPPVAPEWTKPFGEGAKAFSTFKEPADLVKAWGDRETELTTLKGKTFDFRSLADPTDEKATKFLGRFTDGKAFLKTALEAQDKIHSGELKRIDLARATPEQVKEYRQANGIPLEAGDYWKALPDGLVIGKDDQPAFDQYGKIMHEHNVPPALAQAFAKQYYADQQSIAAAEAQTDRADALKATEALRTEWGNDYGPNRAILDNFLEGLGADIKPLFMDATLGNGTRLFNEPAVIKFLADAARKLNPAAHLIPSGEGTMLSVQSEIDTIEALMKTDRTAYNKDEKKQARLRDLYAARQQMAKK